MIVRKEAKTYLAQLMGPLTVSAVYAFLYVPVIVLVLFSFNKTLFSPVRWSGFTLEWYRTLFQMTELLAAFKTSMIVAIVSTTLSVMFGTLFVFASRWWHRAQLFFSIFHANIILPDIILAIGLLSFFTYLSIPLGYGSLIVGHSLIGLGFVIPIVHARFDTLEPHLTEASADLGATYFQTLRLVIVPLLMPALIAAGLLVFTLSLDDFFIAFFCSGTHVQTLSVYVFMLMREGLDPSINAISTCLLGLSSILVLIVCRLKIFDQVIAYD